MPTTLKTITLNAARSYTFPEGSSRHGYVLNAPLTEDGKIDVEAWKARQGECHVRRFWGADPQQSGFLRYLSDDAQGASWRLDLGDDYATEEQGFRFGEHVFRPDEYVSIREADGEMATFRVVSVE